MNQYSRVSYVDRCQIFAMLSSGFSIKSIATQLDFDKSTIYRELKRNKVNLSDKTRFIYHPVNAENKARKRGLKRGRKKIITGKIKYIVVSKLKLGWGPEMIAGRYRKELKKSLSHQTIYTFIKENPKLKSHTRFMTKRGAGRVRQNKTRSETLLNISARPASAKNRSRFGHWERDGMYGSNRKQLLVCLERKSRFIRISKMETVKSNEVNKLTRKTLNKDKVLSLTNDNGTEFRRPESSQYPVYYCDPLKPHQRGSVENAIGKLRRYITRKTNLELMTKKELKEIEKKYNNTPRKMFDFQTPYEVYYKKKVALVI